MKVMVLIPAYNEESTIGNVLEETRTHLPDSRVVVVNDCSTDGTKTILDSHPESTSLDHPFNVGIGGAIRTGLLYFLEGDFDILVRLDGDGQHPPEQANNLLKPILENRADAVIGSRFIEKEGYQPSLSRKGGINLLNLLSRFILGLKITDNTSGFKAYTRAVISNIVEDIPSDYPEPIEVYLMARRGYRIVEVPVRMKERQGGLSSIGLLESYYYLMKVLLTVFVRFFIGGT
jgi:glycosyltransferase involved in cell wall biosynthesis